MTFPEQEHLGPGNRIMVIVAHPDDAEFMCAGSVAKWTQEGKEAVYVIATNGNKGSPDRDIDIAELAKTREAEQRAACAVLGVKDVEFLGHEDGMLQNALELRFEVVRMIRKHRPSAVITENPTSRWSGNYVNHPDHRAIGDATMDAVFPSARDFHMWPELYHDEGLEPHIVDHLYLSMRGTDANVYIDIAGTLPHHREIDSFIKDTSPDKREELVDRLLGSEAYATWWSMFLTDLTGSNIQQMGSTDINWAAASQWEAWLKRRVVDNDGWDKIAAGILLASSRRPDQSYLEYTQEQSDYLRRTDPVDAATLDFPMHYYWFRSDATKPLERALSFGYIFLGVRLQCAQCHKHPFDRWSKQDFDQFTNIFSRVRIGSAPDSRRDELNLRHRLGVPVKLDTAALRRQMYMRVFAEGLPIPYKEVYIQPPGPKPSPARLLGGEELDINALDDPREPLVEWLLRKDNPYFARAFVNRIWSRYFGRGIVDPPDDFNVGNPPSNALLLDWLAREFVGHGYDMKWLHRTIALSRTYQLGSGTTATNASDTRHFSHAALRRLPAEVIVDGILQATANNDGNRDRLSNMSQRRIGKHPGNLSKTSFDYALGVFGKPTRSTNCDCERTNQPTLLQSLYTRNDSEMLERIDRDDGWVCQVAHNLKIPLLSRNGSGSPVRARGSAVDKIAEEITPEYLTTEAYLRTLGRRPSVAETARCKTHFAGSQNLIEGLRDLMWALLNTQEFLTNH